MTIKVKNVKGTIDFPTGVAGLTPTFTADSSGSRLLDSAYTGNNAGDMFWDSANSQLKMFVNDSSGWYNITTTDSAGAFAASPSGPQFIGYYSTYTVSGGIATFNYSNMIKAGGDASLEVELDDTIICVFGRGNSYGYYPGNTPYERYSNNFDYVSGAGQSGNDTYDHDHAIFVKTVNPLYSSASFYPDNLGTTYYQACAFHFFVFRNVTGVDSGDAALYNNRSRFEYANNIQADLTAANQFVVFSHAHGWYSSSGVASIGSAYYEADPGRLSTLAYDTDSINMQSWLYKSTAAETWGNQAFSTTSYTSSSDATIVSCRVY
jgi:hypothetical protein